MGNEALLCLVPDTTAAVAHRRDACEWNARGRNLRLTAPPSTAELARGFWKPLAFCFEAEFDEFDASLPSA